MAITHDVGSFYWHTMVYPIKPKVLFDRAETQEIEEPYRAGKGWAVRLPFTRLALVFGHWYTQFEESMAFTRAISGRAIPQQEYMDTVRPVYEEIYNNDI